MNTAVLGGAIVLLAYFKKLRYARVWKRILLERLTEPLHLNLLSIPVFLFGSFRQKVAFDLVPKHQYAYGILKAADLAKAQGVSTISVIEFGVASGAGLLNMVRLAEKVTKLTGIGIRIYGFDSGTGMPPPVDYRDHPDQYQTGDFAMQRDMLESRLPPNAKLVVGELKDTVDGFLKSLPGSEPIGFVAIDVDYYSSTKDAMRVLQGTPEQYLPLAVVYCDDTFLEVHNSWCGELLAINEFNDENAMRKIERYRFFENFRIFKNAIWVKQMFQLHVLDHPTRNRIITTDKKRSLENPYLDYADNRDSFSV